MSNFCATCGAKLQDSWHHCINCGIRIIKESKVKQVNVVNDPNQVAINDELTDNFYKINQSKKSNKVILAFVTIFIISMLGLSIANISKKDNQTLTMVPTPTPSNSYALSDPYSYEAPKLDDPAKILERLNNNDLGVKWIEDPFGLIGPFAKYQKFIEGLYITYDCGVFVLTDEHSADPLFDNWGKKMTYWTITDSLTGKFIRIQTDSGTNVESRPCVIAAGNTFNYTLTNN
jgi:DNA-directed RNA polymerase subunit RPC12/RpoP